MANIFFLCLPSPQNFIKNKCRSLYIPQKTYVGNFPSLKKTVSANLHPYFLRSYSNPSVGKLKVPRFFFKILVTFKLDLLYMAILIKFIKILSFYEHAGSFFKSVDQSCLLSDADSHTLESLNENTCHYLVT